MRQNYTHKERYGKEFSQRKRDDDNEDGTFIIKMTITPDVNSTRQGHRRLIFPVCVKDTIRNKHASDNSMCRKHTTELRATELQLY